MGFTTKLTPALGSFYSRSRLFSHTMPKRHLHRGKDKCYLELWNKEGFDFSSIGGHETYRFYQSPELVERIMSVMTVALLQGKCPFVSAFPASSKVVMKMYETISPAKTEMNSLFKYLRSPKGPESRTTLAMMKASCANNVGIPRQSLLSMSYALTSSVQHLESAASWGFVNHFGKYNYLSMVRNYRSFMQEMGMGIHKQNLDYSYLDNRGCSLIRKYNRLMVGDFHVLCLPWEKVDRYIYDSKPHNIPTGIRASAVADNPAAYVDSLVRERTHMATMFLCKETLDPSSGISVITANNPSEVESFCAGHVLTPMKKVPAYEDLVSPISTFFEREQAIEREKYDIELDQFVRQFQNFLHTGRIDDSMVDKPIEGFLSEDLPD